MNRIFTAFIEHKEFKKSRPWTVVEQRYSSLTVSTPHYADTVEILLYDNARGSAYIGGRKFEITGKQVFYIPPQTVHSFEYLPSDGEILVVKLQPSMLRDFINTERILSEYGVSLASLEINQTNYDDFYPFVKVLRENDDVSCALSSIISILNLLVRGTREKENSKLSGSSESSANMINEIIAWTEKNYQRRFSLDEVSGRFGYTKNYFCDMFKSKTGITYLKYLNTLRISNACDMIKTGIPINRVSHLCGFETDSYFIQLFKKTIGVTPKQYQMGKMR
ncbi:MAG: AraC family transcriptional regulator [Ruminococcaceae bacterium]|nr:AraC family transcriptional regulator [Oscillospiraceae bacterium]